MTPSLVSLMSDTPFQSGSSGRSWRIVSRIRRTSAALPPDPIVTDFAGRYEPAMRQMGEWIKSGKLKYREDVVQGIDKAPRAFIGLLRGENFGKLLVKMS